MNGMLDAIMSVWKAISPDIFEVCSGYLNWSLEDLSLDAGHSLDEARKIVKENLSARQNPIIVWLLIGLIYRANFCKMCSTPQSFQGNPWQEDRHVLRSQSVAYSSGVLQVEKL